VSDDQPYDLSYSRAARNDLAARLPEKIVTAAVELITGALRSNPHRVGKPLRDAYEGMHAANRSTYRVIYQINDETRTVHIVAIRQHGHAYRT
jgi:mRNA interferase RelE/StbE